MMKNQNSKYPNEFKIKCFYAMLKITMKNAPILKISLLIFYSSFSFFNCVFAEETVTPNSDFEKRIRELEKRNAISSVRESDEDNLIRSFLSDNIRLGGFFEPVFLTDWGPRTPTRSGLVQNTLGINLSTTMNTRTRFITQFLMNSRSASLNPHNDSRGVIAGTTPTRKYGTTDTGVQVAQGYIEYRATDIFFIRGGTGYAPFGIAAQTRELVLFARQSGPEMLRTEGLINRTWSGLHIQGFQGLDEGFWGYHLYTTSSQPHPSTPGVGTRLWVSSKDELVTFGISSQLGQNNRGYQTWGSDILLQFDSLDIYAEYAHSYYNDHQNPYSFYLEPNVELWDQQVLFYAFGDFELSPLNRTLALEDPYQRWIYGIGVNWLPTSLIRLRLGVAHSDYTQNDRNYSSVNLSAGISF